MEEKRDKYQEVIKYILPQSLVYIDESGIDMNICKDREDLCITNLPE